MLCQIAVAMLVPVWRAFCAGDGVHSDTSSFQLKSWPHRPASTAAYLAAAPSRWLAIGISGRVVRRVTVLHAVRINQPFLAL